MVTVSGSSYGWPWPSMYYREYRKGLSYWHLEMSVPNPSNSSSVRSSEKISSLRTRTLCGLLRKELNQTFCRKFAKVRSSLLEMSELNPLNSSSVPTSERVRFAAILNLMRFGPNWTFCWKFGLNFWRSLIRCGPNQKVCAPAKPNLSKVLSSLLAVDDPLHYDGKSSKWLYIFPAVVPTAGRYFPHHSWSRSPGLNFKKGLLRWDNAFKLIFIV